MKKMKKLFAILMTMAMVMGLSITGFAADGNDWTISVSGTGIDQATVQYGQIIEADPTSTQGWSFVGGNDGDLATAFVEGWNSVTTPVSTLDAEDVIDALFDIAESTPNTNVEAGTIHNSANLSAALAAVTTYAKENITNGSVDVSRRENKNGAGLYIIVANRSGYTYLPMAAYMDSDGTNVNVVAKGAEDQLVKVVDESGESVAPGDVVNYTITQPYLYIAPNVTKKEFWISDTITNGVIDQDSFSISYKDTVEAETSTTLAREKYSITWSPEGENTEKTGFRVDFSDKYDANLAGKILVITYSVTVNDEFAPGTTTVSNKATSSNGTGTIVNTEPVSFEVTKKVLGEDTLLGGAEFTIYKEVPEAIEGETTTITYNGETKNVIVVGSPITTSSANDGTLGKATIDGLDAQETYYVKETKAPEGYSLNDTVYLLTGANETTSGQPTEETVGNVTYKVYTHTYSDFDGQTVEDTTISALPSTGGMGTTLFTIAGCVIMISAAGLFFATRKKAN